MGDVAVLGHRLIMAVRTFDQECGYLEKVTKCAYRIKKGFVPNMNVRVSVLFPSLRAYECLACVG